MSVIVAGSAAAAIATVATVVVASLPQAQAVLSPLTEGGNEYVIASASFLTSLPLLVLMIVLAIWARK